MSKLSQPGFGKGAVSVEAFPLLDGGGTHVQVNRGTFQYSIPLVIGPVRTRNGSNKMPEFFLYPVSVPWVLFVRAKHGSRTCTPQC